MDKHARILVVDDDERIRSILKKILVYEGYRVDLAATGSDAIQKTKKTAYNLAIIDIRLPDMEGVELLELMNDGVPKTRKIIVTGYPSMQNAITALNKNADAYVIKPVDLDRLLAIVEQQLLLQENERKFSEQKISEFIQTRAKEIVNARDKESGKLL